MSALAQPTRLAIFSRLAGAGSEGVGSGDLARAAGAPANTISAHLAILDRAGLVEQTRDGRRVVYRTVPARLAELIGFMAQLGAGVS